MRRGKGKKNGGIPLLNRTFPDAFHLIIQHENIVIFPVSPNLASFFMAFLVSALVAPLELHEILSKLEG